MYTHIIHLADIHLRSGNVQQARQVEYEVVIRNLEERLSRLECVQKKTALIVVCGDVFHNKSKLETPTVKLWTLFLQTLTRLGHVIMICGNHDFRQEDPECPDLIEAMLESTDRSGVSYLKQTGIYTFDNVTIGTVSIKDTLKQYDTFGMADQLPEFPIPASHETSAVSVALFHGTITQSALPNGQCMASGKGYPLEWFKGYDLVLLGDNHKQQINHSDALNFSWGYPGSLVQQDIGEPILGHGFLLWDLEARTAKAYHVYNPYARMRVKLLDDALHVKVDADTYIMLDEVAQGKTFPKTPNVQLIGTTADELKVKDILNQHDIHPVAISTVLALHRYAHGTDDDRSDGDMPTSMNDIVGNIASVNHPSRWLEFIESTDPALATQLRQEQWFDSPEKMQMDALLDADLPKDLLQKIQDRREKIQSAVDAYRSVREKTVVRSSVILKNMKWDWAFSYGECNWFNFEKLEGSIAVLNGKNASGKSSFIDTLCIAIFGEPGKNRNTNSARKVTTDFLHTQRPPKTAMQTSITLSVDGTLFEILRSYTHHENKHDDNTSHVRKCELYRFEGDGSKVRVCSGTTMVDAWVGKHCGTLEDLLRTTVVSQFDNYNFFMLKPQEQKDMIDAALNMESLKAFANIVDVAFNGYTYLIDALGTAISASEASAKAVVVKYEDDDEDEDGANLEDMEKRLDDLEAAKDALAIECAPQLQKGTPALSESEVSALLNAMGSSGACERSSVRSLETAIARMEAQLASLACEQVHAGELCDCAEDLRNHERMKPKMDFSITDLRIRERLLDQWWMSNAQAIHDIDLQYKTYDAVVQANESAQAAYRTWQTEWVVPKGSWNSAGERCSDGAATGDVERWIGEYRSFKAVVDEKRATAQSQNDFIRKYDAYAQEASAVGWDSLGIEKCNILRQRKTVQATDAEWTALACRAEASGFKDAESVRMAILQKLVSANQSRFSRLANKVATMDAIDGAAVYSQIEERNRLVCERALLRKFRKMKTMDQVYLKAQLDEVALKLKGIDYRQLTRMRTKYEKQQQMKSNIEFATRYVGDARAHRMSAAELEKLHADWVLYETHLETMNTYFEAFPDADDRLRWRDVETGVLERAGHVLQYLVDHRDNYSEVKHQRNQLVEAEKRLVKLHKRAYDGWVAQSLRLK